MIIRLNAKTFVQSLVMLISGFVLFACEAATDSLMSDDPAAAMNKNLVGKVSAGIRPVDNTLLAEEQAEVLFYLNNGTDEAIEVLPWATPLEAIISADLFVVTKSGERIPYAGRMVKRAAPTAEDYLVINVGEKRETVLNLSQAYNLREEGEYQIVLESLRMQGPTGSIDVVIVEDTVGLIRQ